MNNIVFSAASLQDEFGKHIVHVIGVIGDTDMKSQIFWINE